MECEGYSICKTIKREVLSNFYGFKISTDAEMVFHAIEEDF